MEKIRIKKPLDLHKFNTKINKIMLNWKIIIPTVISVSGIFAGAVTAKGEGAFYYGIIPYIQKFLIKPENQTNYASLIIYLLVPTLFAAAIFFSGLSVYGNVTVNIIPFTYSFASGLITYFLFQSYTLKGLGYIVIMFLPYAVLSLLALILMSAESIDMSQVLLKKLSRTKRMSEYSFNIYYKNCIKSYILIIIAAIIKTIIDSLFVGLFIF